MIFVRFLHGSAVRNFFAAVIVIAIGFGANGLKGAVTGDQYAIGLTIAEYSLLTPIVLTPLLLLQWHSAGIFALAPLLLTVVVAGLLAGLTAAMRDTFESRAALVAFGEVLMLAVFLGVVAPTLEFKLTF